MTGAKVKQVLQSYLDHFEAEDLKAGLSVGAQKMSDADALRRAPDVDDLAWAAHLKYMCVEAQKFVDEGRVEKAMRWLGFLQGVLWESGEFSLDDLKEHSRPAEGDGQDGRSEYVVDVFRAYDCRDRLGIKIGRSVLSSGWNAGGVLGQLRVDGCPVGREGEARVVGWPGDRFNVEVREAGEASRTYWFEVAPAGG
jgi:hypothetical protein